MSGRKPSYEELEKRLERAEGCWIRCAGARWTW